MVEKWLFQVEEVMISSLKKVTEDAVNVYNQTPRGKWVQEWPGQVRCEIKYSQHQICVCHVTALLISP